MENEGSRDNEKAKIRVEKMLEGSGISFAEGDDNDNKALYEKVCSLLDGVMPKGLFEDFKNIRPYAFALMGLLPMGGSVLLKFPELDLTKKYAASDEVKELNDEVDGFSFTTAPEPFVALGQAFRAGQNIDEEIIMSLDLDGYVPLIISEGEEKTPTHVYLADIEKRDLQITLGASFSLRLNATGTEEETEKAMASGMKEIENHLDDVKSIMEKGPKWDATPEEQKAVRAWAEKHSYTLTFVFRTGVDIFN